MEVADFPVPSVYCMARCCANAGLALCLDDVDVACFVFLTPVDSEVNRQL